MSECYCKDWIDNIDKIDGPMVLQQCRTGVIIEDLVRFRYCPWCRDVLKDKNITTKDDKCKIYDNPDWDDDSKTHNWKNYISDDMKAYWAAFTMHQKRIIYENANNMAGRKEGD